MLQSSIFNTVKDIHGVVVPNAPVTIKLNSPGFRIDDATEVATQYNLIADGTGFWQIGLEQNGNINTPETYYTALETIPAAQGGPKKWSFRVGAVTPQSLAAALIPPPFVPAPHPNALTQAMADLRYVQIGQTISTSTSNIFTAKQIFKTGPWVDISAYSGVVGDDSTDCTTGINQAFSDAFTAGLPVFIPVGKFRHQGINQTYAGKVVVFGLGSLSQLRCTKTDDTPNLLITGASEANLFDFYVDHVSTPTRRLGHGASLVSVAGGFVHNVVVGSAVGVGIYTENTQNLDIISNVVRNTLADGIHTTGGVTGGQSLNNLVAFNKVTNSGDDGIAFVNYRSALIGRGFIATGNIVKNSAAHGIAQWGGEDAMIFGNKVEGSANQGIFVIAGDTGFNTWNVVNPVIDGNTIRGVVAGSSIAAFSQSATYPVTSPKIQNNTIQGGASHAVEVGLSTVSAGVLRPKIVNNSATGPNGTGVGTYIAGSTRPKVVLNDYYQQGARGIHIDSTCTGAVEISLNTVDDCNQSGTANLDGILNQVSSPCTLVGNTIVDPSARLTNSITVATLTNLRQKANNLGGRPTNILFTVTGSRAGNVALTNLLSVGSASGDFIDGSSA